MSLTPEQRKRSPEAYAVFAEVVRQRAKRMSIYNAADAAGLAQDAEKLADMVDELIAPPLPSALTGELGPSRIEEILVLATEWWREQNLKCERPFEDLAVEGFKHVQGLLFVAQQIGERLKVESAIPASLAEIETRWKNTGQTWADVQGYNYHCDVPKLLSMLKRGPDREALAKVVEPFVDQFDGNSTTRRYLCADALIASGGWGVGSDAK